MQFTKAFFDQQIDRSNTDNIKWDMARAGGHEDTIPMWVADMDFASPPAIVQALLARASHPFYGYTTFSQELKQSVVDFWKRRHHVAFTTEMIDILPSVVAGMNVALRAVSEEGERVLIQTPLYGPFRATIQATKRTVCECPMIHRADGGYDMNLAAMEAAFKDGVRVMMLCNPHNPVSRCWRAAELKQLAELLDRYHVTLISDEIHADFTYEEEMTSMISLMKERLIVLVAPSKTFNVAGLQTAFSVCPDASLQEKIKAVVVEIGVHAGNIFGMTAAQAAMTSCDDWLDGLQAYLKKNRETLKTLLKELLPKAVLTPMEATYLGWLGLKAYGLSDDEIQRKTHEAGVWFNRGTDFGENGSGFIRINIGCPRAQLEEAVRRLAAAINGQK